MGNNALTEFGKSIKRRLIDIDRNQNWLIDEVREKTGLYFDNGYLWRIQTGQLFTPKIVSAICEILDIPADPDSITE